MRDCAVSFVVVGISSFVLGCSGAEANDDPYAPPVIASFSITEGSSSLAPGDTLRVGMRVTGPSIYHQRVYLSLDESKDDDDPHLAGRNCGATFDAVNEPDDCTGFDCAYKPDADGAYLSCEDEDSPLTDEVVIEMFLGAATGSAFLVGEGCNARFDCVTTSIPVSFTAD